MPNDQQLEDDLASLRIDPEGRGAPAQRSNPKKRGRMASALALAFFASLCVGGWLLFREGQNRIFPDEVEVGSVTLISPSQEEVTLVATGYVYPKRRATVAPKSVGRLARLFVDEGDLVKENQVIGELETAEPMAQSQQLMADVAAAQARVERARADLMDTEAKFAREDDLLNKGAGTAASRDDANLRVGIARAQLRAAEAEVKAVEARHAANAVQLENTKVRAPFTGTVLRKLAEVGEVLAPAIAGSQVGVVQIASLDALEVWADVSEAQFSKVKLGTPSEIVLDAFPDRRFRGQVSDIRPAVDRSKAAITVKVKFIDYSKGVLPDMAAKVSFLAQALGEAQLKAEPKLVAPPDTIVNRGGKKVIYTIDEGQVREVAVTVGTSVGGMVELISGPTTGTRVVRHPAPELHDGSSIKEKKK